MKSFLTYLKEIETKRLMKSDIADLDVIGEMIAKNCAPFLKDIGFNEEMNIGSDFPLLFRGMGKNDAVLLRKNVRNDRRDLDIPEIVSNYIDDAFLRVYDHRYHTNSLFASSNQEQAKTYGDVFIIFPVGNYEAIWSYEIYDLYYQLHVALFNSVVDEYGNRTPADELMSALEEISAGGAISSRDFMLNLFQMADSNNLTDGLYQPLFDVLQKYDMIERFEDILDQLVKSYYTKDSLSEYITSGTRSEVMVKTDEYIALNYDQLIKYELQGYDSLPKVIGKHY